MKIKPIQKYDRSFIIKSGLGHSIGYFVRFNKETPEMTTDPVSATRFLSKEIAQSYLNEFERLGFNAELIEVRFGRIRKSVWSSQLKPV